MNLLQVISGSRLREVWRLRFLRIIFSFINSSRVEPPMMTDGLNDNDEERAAAKNEKLCVAKHLDRGRVPWGRRPVAWSERGRVFRLGARA